MSDLINRAETLEAIKRYFRKAIDEIDGEAGFEYISDACEAILKYSLDICKMIEALPSAEPKQPDFGPISCISAEKMHDRTTDGLISRQAAIDVVDSETVSTNPEHFKSSEKFIKFMDDADIASFGKWQWANGFNTALAATSIQLEKLPSAQPEQRWIPCRERLPSEDGKYLIVGRQGAVNILPYRDGRWYGRWSVIAWMPLPEPYKEGE